MVRVAVDGSPTPPGDLERSWSPATHGRPCGRIPMRPTGRASRRQREAFSPPFDPRLSGRYACRWSFQPDRPSASDRWRTDRSDSASSVLASWASPLISSPATCPLVDRQSPGHRCGRCVARGSGASPRHMLYPMLFTEKSAVFVTRRGVTPFRQTCSPAAHFKNCREKLSLDDAKPKVTGSSPVAGAICAGQQPCRRSRRTQPMLYRPVLHGSPLVMVQPAGSDGARSASSTSS
jgi:hypothetical protein